MFMFIDEKVGKAFKRPKLLLAYIKGKNLKDNLVFSDLRCKPLISRLLNSPCFSCARCNSIFCTGVFKTPTQDRLLK